MSAFLRLALFPLELLTPVSTGLGFEKGMCVWCEKIRVSLLFLLVDFVRTGHNSDILLIYTKYLIWNVLILVKVNLGF